ncbi:hypothetical protein LCGC14_0335380 [marine sediment metagenome]|uniref:30S ribosomal protein S9 n=1 Tax=marine sediment metagenome TaxID=412755 RepID=A0A0F9TKW6_9ZZZZ
MAKDDDTQQADPQPAGDDAPEAEAPKKEKPKAEAPKKEKPKAEAPKKEKPKAEAPKEEKPKAEAPKKEKPEAEAPKKEEPEAEAPKKEKPKAEAPKKEKPKAEAPKKEKPKAEAPKKEEPKAEAPEADAPVAEAPKEEKPAAPKRTAPALPDGVHYIWGTGRRKRAVARVRIRPGSGKILINKREPAAYFPALRDQNAIVAPLEAAEMMASWDMWVNVGGGGTTGQADAVSLGLARALSKAMPELESTFRHLGLLTRDARQVERKKYGQPGARKRFQFSKR